MGKIVGIASGKGGIGRTTIAINLAHSFSYFGRESILVDACLEIPHVIIHLGMPFNINTLNDVIKGRKDIKEAIYTHPSGVRLISSSLSLDYSISLDELAKHIPKLKDFAEIILIDVPPGFGNLPILKKCDELLIVTNPEQAAIYDALKLIKLAEENRIKIKGVVVNKQNESDYEMHLENIKALVKHEIIGVIPYSTEFKLSHKSKYPITYIHPHTNVSIRIKEIAALLINEKYETNLPVYEKPFLREIAERLGFR